MAERQTKTFTATIGRTNDHGFQIQERPGVWLNLSKFAAPQPAIPPAGTSARLTLDSSGFVRAIEPLADPEVPQPALSLSTERSSLGASITRMAVLKAAARFHAGRPDATDADVLASAAAYERWIEGS